MTAEIMPPPRRTRRRPASRIWAWAGTVAILVGLLVAWQLLGIAINDESRLPTPLAIVHYARPLLADGSLLINARASVLRVLVGFGAAVIIGLPLGLLMGSSRVVAQLTDPAVNLLRPVPALGLLPLLLAVIGISDFLAPVIVFYAAVFPIVVNTAVGVRLVQPAYLEAAQTLGARKVAVLREVLLPGAAGPILVGLRTGLQFAWMSIVGAEMVGATSGLGYATLYYSQFLQTGNVVVGMAAIGVLGLLLDAALVRGVRFLTPWMVTK